MSSTIPLPPFGCLRSFYGDWKPAMTADAKRAELHHILTDRAGATDVAKDNPGIFARLTKLALDCKATLPKEPNPECRSPRN